MKKNLKFFLITRNTKSGFALTQILILAIGLSLTITALITTAVNRLTITRIKKLELDARNASDSSITVIKSLFNNRNNRAFNYYWFLKTCSESINKENCPIEPRKYRGENTLVKDISSLYWDDTNNWCRNNEDCFGRQIAPKCTAINNFSKRSLAIDWLNFNSYISNFLEREISISDHFGNNQKDQFQSFSIKSIEFVGDDTTGGTTSFLVEGISRNNINSSIKTASNKLRVNIKVIPEVAKSGFAFISAGENDSDKDSLYLGNLDIIGDTGTILWRRNILNDFECSRLNQISGLNQFSNIPSYGGIWVQPIYSPPNPYLKIRRNSIINLGNLYCFKNQTTLNNCNSDYWGNNDQLEKVFKIKNLLIHGDNTELKIITSNESKITIIIDGSVDINFGGKICHIDKRDFLQKCGSGKSSNLSLILNPEERNFDEQQKLQCSINGGLEYIRDKKIPNNSFLLGNTGNDDSEILTSFIYAPTSTFTTSQPNLNFYQDSSNNSKLIIYRGIYSYIENINSYSDPLFFKDPAGNLINFTSNFNNVFVNNFFDDLYLIGVGKRSENISPSENTMINMALVKKNNEYFLVGFTIENNSVQFVNKNTNGRIWKKSLGTNPKESFDENGNLWINYYGINLKNTNKFHPNINIEGAVWAKNICLDQKIVNWEFRKEFIDNFIDRYGLEFNYGVPFYRGTSIEVWDTMRDFSY